MQDFKKQELSIKTDTWQELIATIKKMIHTRLVMKELRLRTPPVTKIIVLRVLHMVIFTLFPRRFG